MHTLCVEDSAIQNPIAMSKHPEETTQFTGPDDIGPTTPPSLSEQATRELANEKAAKKSYEKAINDNEHEWWLPKNFWQIVTQLLALTALVVSAWNLKVAQQQLTASQEQFRLSERPLILGRVQDIRRSNATTQLEIPVRLGNYGKSAALAVSGISETFTGPTAPGDVDRWFQKEAASSTRSPIHWVVPPGIGTSAPDAFTAHVPITATLPINLDELPTGHGGRGLNALFLAMRVTYRDSLNHWYSTDICAYFTREAIEYCGQHNTAGDSVNPPAVSRAAPYP